MPSLDYVINVRPLPIILLNFVMLVPNIFQNCLLQEEEEEEEVKVVTVSEEAKQREYQKAAKILDNARLVRSLSVKILIAD